MSSLLKAFRKNCGLYYYKISSITLAVFVVFTYTQYCICVNYALSAVDQISMITEQPNSLKLSKVGIQDKQKLF